MSRVQENDGQEITFEDLNRIQQLTESELYERVLYQLCNRTDGFFQDSFFADFSDATHVSVRAGLGVQHDTTQVAPESQRRLFYRASAVVLAITIPDGTNPRIDIVVAKADRVTTDSESRQVKDFITNVVAPQTIVTETDWQATVSIVAGVAAGSPVAPAVPSGYVKIATLAVAATTGMASQASVTDNRVVMPILAETYIDTSGFSNVATLGVQTPLKTVLADLDTLGGVAGQVTAMYDAIVGSAGYCNYANLNAALATSSAGWRILVTENQTLNAALAVTLANIEIHLKPAVTIAKGTATTGIDVQAGGTGFELHGGRISGFSGAGNKAVKFAAAAAYGKIWGVRFANNDTDIDDSLVTVASFGNINE